MNIPVEEGTKPHCIPELNYHYDEEELAKKIKKEWCVTIRHPQLIFKKICHYSPVALVAKNPPANAGDLRDMGLISELGRSSGGGHGNPLQYSCLGNPMDRGT